MENEEKTVITVENEGGKGNPNHKPAGSPDGGQFTSKNDAGSGSVEAPKKSGEDYLGVFELQKEEKVSDLKSIMLDFAGRKKQILTQQAVEYMNSVSQYIPDYRKEHYSKLSKQEKLDLLSNNITAGYDPIRLKFASEEQLTALLYAEAIQYGPMHLEQQRLLWEHDKKNLNSKIQEELFVYNSTYISGVWSNKSPTPSDYKDLKESGSFDKKVEFYNSVLKDSVVPLSDKMKATQYLKKLEQFEKEGLEYEQKKAEISAKYIDNLEEIEAKLSEIKSQKAKFLDENGNKTDLIKNANAFADKFKDINSAYSPVRKNNAIWFGSSDSSKNWHDALEFFGSPFEKMWDSMTKTQQLTLKEYTNSPSKFNEPLRHIKYAGVKTFQHATGVSSKAQKMAHSIKNMTDAIDKCTWEHDIWVQRGVSASTKMFSLDGQARDIASMTNEERQKMVGTVFVDRGFYSAGAGKGTGFANESLIINTYCPKGTKMAYMNTHGHFAYGHENEMILQRGYTYRITKIENKYGQFYIDCEVVLGSDSNKPVGADLEEIGEKFYA